VIEPGRLWDSRPHAPACIVESATSSNAALVTVTSRSPAPRPDDARAALAFVFTHLKREPRPELPVGCGSPPIVHGTTIRLAPRLRCHQPPILLARLPAIVDSSAALDGGADFARSTNGVQASIAAGAGHLPSSALPLAARAGDCGALDTLQYPS